MNIAISNIAWNGSQELQVFELLQRNNVEFVEVAFTKICDWDNISTKHVADYRKKLQRFGLSPCNVQSLMYGKDFNIFENPQAARKHFKLIFELSQELGARNLVFGSPKNRISKGGQVDELSFEHLLDFVENELQGTEIKFNIECNPKIYGCNFITTPSQAIRYSKNRKNIGFHLDTACCELSKEPIDGCQIDSVHISEPYLNNFDEPSSYHEKYRNLLHKSQYRDIISIEMKETNLQSIENAIKFVKSEYLNK